MTDPNRPPPVATGSYSGGAFHEMDDPDTIILGRKSGVMLLNHDYLVVLAQMQLPGVVIFVHGVNSDGEWYQQAEDGLCRGLNERLKRCDEHMKHPSPEGGQLTPVKYRSGLSDDGYLNPDLTANNFIDPAENFSPVIQFRWGYKASEEELQTYGDSIYLNEENYWGGGPFANGCSALPDLWGEGLSDTLFLWVHVEHLNPLNERSVYSCPPRPYFVLAALRLARLVESIRHKQPDVPITMVCHSQGNMVGIAAAFLGDKMKDFSRRGRTGRCVADSYVLCNPPLSLLEKNSVESWIQGQTPDKDGKVGRQTGRARMRTLAAFFDIVRRQASHPQPVADIDEFMANRAHGFDILSDRIAYGYGIKPSTLGRVTLYCNPHDKVVSATTIQGIGWRGMSEAEIDAAGGRGMFCQRVFAQGYSVGVQGHYDYWADHYNTPPRGSLQFWSPLSPAARYSTNKGRSANTSSVGEIMTLVSVPIFKPLLAWSDTRIHALPPNDWRIPLSAPELPHVFTPVAVRFGARSTYFNQHFDPPGAARNKDAVPDPKESYAGDRLITPGAEGERRDASDAAQGDRDSEAALRYEDHALLRMKAKREKIVAKDAPKAPEDELNKASEQYKQWRDQQIKAKLANSLDTHATNHSTIMTNPMHAQSALAYDIAIGMCHIRAEDWCELRIEADWRLVGQLDEQNSAQIFDEYFRTGKFKKVALTAWTKAPGSDGGMPEKIVDEREFTPTPRDN